MSKGGRLKMEKEKELPEGAFKLNRMEVSAAANCRQGQAEMAEMWKHWREHEKKVLIPTQDAVNKKIEGVYDDLCEAHGIERNGREVVVSKDLTTFTLKEKTDAQESHQAQENAAPRILGADGRPINSGVVGFPRSLKPNQPGGLTPEDAGAILQAVEANRN